MKNILQKKSLHRITIHIPFMDNSHTIHRKFTYHSGQFTYHSRKIHVPFMDNSRTIDVPKTYHSGTIDVPFTDNLSTIHVPFTYHLRTIHVPFTYPSRICASSLFPKYFLFIYVRTVCALVDYSISTTYTH